MDCLWRPRGLQPIECYCGREQRSADFLHEGSDCRHFRLRGPCGSATEQESSCREDINECIWPCSNKTLFTKTVTGCSAPTLVKNVAAEARWARGRIVASPSPSRVSRGTFLTPSSLSFFICEVGRQSYLSHMQCPRVPRSGRREEAPGIGQFLQCHCPLFQRAGFSQRPVSDCTAAMHSE